MDLSRPYGRGPAKWQSVFVAWTDTGVKNKICGITSVEDAEVAVLARGLTPN